MTPFLARAVLAAAFLAPVSGARQEPQRFPPPTASSDLDSLATALRAQDWPLVLRLASSLRAASRPSTPSWLEATAALVRAHHHLWNPADLEPPARELLRAAADLRAGADSTEIRSAIGPLSPASAARVLQTQLLLARLYQSRGLHAEALGHFRLALDDLQAGPVDGSDGLMAEAGLQAMWSHRALGRAADSHTILHSLRDNFPDTHEGNIATVVLENDVGPSGYAGRYADDPAQKGRLEALWAARTAAGRRVAAALGVDPASVPRVLVGIADRPSWVRNAGGCTFVDPRRPGVPIVTVLYSQMLALGVVRPEGTLVHELAHAVPATRWGLRYERLPLWFVEGLASALAGELEAQAEALVCDGLVADSAGFVRDDYWVRHPPDFASATDAGPPSIWAPILGLLLAETPEPGGMKRFVAEMDAGRSGEEALQSACGLSIAEYRRRAEERAFDRLCGVRAESLPAIASIVTEAAKGAAEGLAASERVLSEGAPRLARAFARIGRAEALEELGRAEDALAAWQAAVDALPESPGFGWIAREGRVRALVLAGWLDEASRSIAELRRAAMDAESLAWVASMEAEVARKRSPK